MYSLKDSLKNIYESEKPCRQDIEKILSLRAPKDMKTLFYFADGVKSQFMGKDVVLRGLVEFSNLCSNTCAYCGLNAANRKLKRYKMSAGEIIEAASGIYARGVKTIVLQSGEDKGLDGDRLSALIKKIKENFDMAVTLSLGEKTYEEYKMWRRAGADRYLLKIETSNKKLYEKLHPGMSFENRLRCLDYLKELKYATGSGNIVGLKGQTIRDIAEDIIFFKKNNFDMIAIGPFIAHPGTALAREKAGSVSLVLKTIALTRIMTRNKHIPAASSLSAGTRDFRDKALSAGANVIMLNFTPPRLRRFYEIYPKIRSSELIVRRKKQFLSPNSQRSVLRTMN